MTTNTLDVQKTHGLADERVVSVVGDKRVTLGEVCYRARYDADLSNWRLCGAKDRWQAAAQAVVREFVGGLDEWKIAQATGTTVITVRGIISHLRTLAASMTEGGEVI